MSRILLLEPDRPLAGVTREFLSRAGHSVDVHTDPQAAVLSADAAYPDIVILDIMLAGRSGIEFLYEFRSYPEWQTTPVIILCSLFGEELEPFAEVLAQLNVSACLHKPTTSLPRLLAHVEKLLQPASA